MQKSKPQQAISDTGNTSTQTENTSNSDGSPSSLRPLNGRGSSGESSNADKWFDQSNNAPRDNSNSYADNDPPFFMRHGSSSESPPDGHHMQSVPQYINHDGSQSLPLRAGQMKLGTPGGSSAEDFRGVIDDLTIENKKLKRRLKKYEKLHDAHLKNDKLFEIRVHGLAADKKRELEELLRNFAGSLATQQPASGFPSNGYEGILPGLKTHQTASSQTSVHHTDSAYASMSASGQGSSVPSGGDSKHRHIVQAAKSRQQNIQSFLHHIPEGLQPNHNLEAMTERAKRKLVVRRLEQIFAGTDALAGPHHQALQQQDVSQMAARADRKANEAQGHQVGTEGLRESAIMNQETEDPLDIGAKRRFAAKGDESLNHSEAEKVAEYDFADQSPESKSDEQRPTRPLDLDPDRAQVPAENVRYIRHLGFSPQDPDTQSKPEDGHGWVYLNLLVNMAQLHTLHVTPDFVRKAVTDCSDHFEVSEDGRKVRWKGGSKVTKTSSYGGGSSRERTDDDIQSPRKKLKTASGKGAQSARVASQRGNRTSARQPHELDRFMYTPLFSHRSSSSDSAVSSSEAEEEDDSPLQHQLGAESSAMTSSGVRTVVAPRKKKSHDTGPIIFYNNARFCTDLSGDSTTRGSSGAPNYKSSTLAPVGRTPVHEGPSQIFEKRGPLEEARLLPEPMDLADNPIPDSQELAFPPPSPPKPGDHVPTLPSVNLEVTGMGGVYPADNFAINIKSHHAAIDQNEAPAVPIASTTKNLPDRFAKILQSDDPQRQIRAAVAQRYLNIECIEHPPSVLPPALCFVPDDDSMSDDESDPVDDMSVSPSSHDALPPSTAPQTMYMPDVDSDDEMEDEHEESSSDAESDDSLDLLATARKADPEAVLRKERQYDAEMAERLAEEIPAGSSAATAGGGSGFASPASGVDKREYRKAKEEARQNQQTAGAPASLKRARTSDSMDVQGQEGSIESSGEDEDEEDGN